MSRSEIRSSNKSSADTKNSVFADEVGSEGLATVDCKSASAKSNFVNCLMISMQELKVARRKPVSIATDGMYRKVGVIALGLAVCAAMFGESSPEAPIASNAAANLESRAQSTTNWNVPASGLSDRDGPAAQDIDAEVAAVLNGGLAAPEEMPMIEPAALPTTGYSDPDAAKGPTQAQIRTIIEQSYRRSGNEGGGD